LGIKQARTSLYARSTSALQIRARKVGRYVRRLRTVMPWLEASDIPAAKAWAELEILGARLFAELTKTPDGFMNAKGEPRRLLSEFRQLRQAQLSFERELGMTPLARMQLKASGTRAALDLAAAMAKAEDAEVIDRPTGADDDGRTGDGNQ